MSKIYLFLFVVTTPSLLAAGFSLWSTEKCIDELGCFDYSLSSPFYDFIERPISLSPSDREDINTYFLLYTPANPDTPQNFSNIRKVEGELAASHYNPEAATKIVVGGYMSGGVEGWKIDIVKALLTHTGSNVFLVDWDGGDGPFYELAVSNTRVVGAEIALLVERLQNEVGLKPKNVHIIGHSLGSHISGYAGKRIKGLGRITGLDPAGPYFTNVDPVVRLDRNDALLVDAIHTNIAYTRLEGFGLIDSIAHFDFYPNGGRLQPGCNETSDALLAAFSANNENNVVDDVSCNHVRAIELFISTIKNTGCEMWGSVCDGWDVYVEGNCGTCLDGQDGFCVPLGMRADQYASKIKKDASLDLFLNTTATEPFCL